MTLAALRSAAAGASTRLRNSKAAYYALILTIFVAGILMLVLPAELITYEPQEKPTIDLSITFSRLSVQGWLALALTGLAFLMMVTDSVG